MAICVDCEREMTTAASCTVTALHIGDLPFALARHRRTGDGRCGDCGVQPGGYHHLGCDLARCPRCGRQLITCGCPFDELDDGPGFDGWADVDDPKDSEDSEDAEDDEDFMDPDGSGDLRPLPWEQSCPRCGSTAVIPILYGIRNPTSTALEAHGVLELGESNDPERPTSRCTDCEHGWTLGRRSA